MKKDLEKMEVSLEEAWALWVASPVVLVSTLSQKKIHNVAPYCMVMQSSINPMTIALGIKKKRDTYKNIKENKEFVVNIPSVKLLREIDICAMPFSSEESEFEKSGLTPIPSLKVKPARVKECKAHLECKLKWIKKCGRS